MAGMKARMTGLVPQYQTTYYHMITIAVNEKLENVYNDKGIKDLGARKRCAA